MAEMTTIDNDFILIKAFGNFLDDVCDHFNRINF